MVIFFLSCALIARAQTDTKSVSKLTGDKPAASEQQTNSIVQAGVNSVSEEFIIGTGDVLAINVWKEPEVSRDVPVRSDGRISLPLVGEIQAGGRTPKQLEA